MSIATASKEPSVAPLDVLRVLALSRIPRCARCPRFRAISRAAEGAEAHRLPPVPTWCRLVVCRPVARRVAHDDGRWS